MIRSLPHPKHQPRDVSLAVISAGTIILVSGPRASCALHTLAGQILSASIQHHQAGRPLSRATRPHAPRSV